jgi:hypothetical protein
VRALTAPDYLALRETHCAHQDSGTGPLRPAHQHTGDPKHSARDGAECEGNLTTVQQLCRHTERRRREQRITSTSTTPPSIVREAPAQCQRTPTVPVHRVTER